MHRKHKLRQRHGVVAAFGAVAALQICDHLVRAYGDVATVQRDAVRLPTLYI